ncbi:hypothetical protein [Pyrobaculum ferrireducens]|uniref:Uncharacterized protein n=1 Tax=Pyrobaculum ferrireducens TaxID=1104324 RepID=G7VFQ2_9CREN|nr:hypothetical protein [Pyrobaculum ferrireducens]AET34258.1 hypothetical protein P186_2882 [Pyrobaculum ferrireducens]
MAGFIKAVAKINKARGLPKPQRYGLYLEAFLEWLSSIAPRGSAFRVAYDICGGSSSCIETIHGAVKWAVERGLVVGVVKLASGWLVPTSQLPSLKAAVLMYKAVVEGGGKLGVKKRRERGVKPPI